MIIMWTCQGKNDNYADLPLKHPLSSCTRQVFAFESTLNHSVLSFWRSVSHCFILCLLVILGGNNNNNKIWISYKSLSTGLWTINLTREFTTSALYKISLTFLWVVRETNLAFDDYCRSILVKSRRLQLIIIYVYYTVRFRITTYSGI